VLIAAAFSSLPELLTSRRATTALDVTVEALIRDLLAELRRSPHIDAADHATISVEYPNLHSPASYTPVGV